MTLSAFSQHETDIWFFPVRSFIQINDSNATAYMPSSGLCSVYYWHQHSLTSSISDKEGNFLFSSVTPAIVSLDGTYGLLIHNAISDTMQNSDSAGYGARSNCIILPKPGFDNRYIIVSTPYYQDSTERISYSEIDMELDGGLGAVINPKNNQLHPWEMSEKLTATYHANGKDIWLMAHVWDSSYFIAFLLTEDGFVSTPVASYIGSSHTDPANTLEWDSNALGDMKFSPGGNFLAVACKRRPYFELFDFDNATGIVSNCRTFSLNQPWSVEFSPDGTILYVSNWGWVPVSTNPAHVRQFDLLAGVDTAIQNSMLTITNYQNYGLCWHSLSLQLASNGKIYLSHPRNGDDYRISAINQPGLLNLSCGFEVDVIDWTYPSNDVTCTPNFFTSYLDKNIMFDDACFGDTTMIYTLTNVAFDSIQWVFTDPQIGLVSVNNQDTIFHQFTAPGAYEVTLKRYRNGYLDELKKILYLWPTLDIQLPEDTLVCGGQPFVAAYNYPNCEFAWVNDQTTDTIFGDTAYLEQHGLWWPELLNHEQYCGNIDSINITLHPDSLDLGGNVIGICNSNPVTLDATIDSASYLWSTGDTTPTVLAITNGVYWVAAQQGTCTFYDTVVVAYDAPLSVNLPDTVPLCDSLPAMVNAGDFPADFLWSPNGETTAAISINAPGQYSVIASNACGDFTDSSVATYMLYPWFTLGNDTTICLGDELLLAPQLQAQGDLLWSTGETLAEILVSDSGLYHLSVSNACGTHKDSILVDTHENLFAFVLDSVGVDTLQSITLNAGPGYTSYYWSTFDTTQSISVSDPDYYWVEVIDSIGCLGSDTILVYGTNSISNTILSKIKVYPNPVKDELIIEFSGTNYTFTQALVKSSVETHGMRLDIPQISLWNNFGQRVTRATAPSGGTGGLVTLDTSALPKGVYLLLIQQGNEKLVVKVVKE